MSLFGKLLVFLYETTFVVTIVVFGTIIGALLAIILPVGLPFLILWKRYVNGDGRKIPEVSRDG